MCLGGVYNRLQSVDQRILSYPMDLVLASAIVSALYYICIAVKVGVRMLLEEPRPDWRGVVKGETSVSRRPVILSR